MRVSGVLLPIVLTIAMAFAQTPVNSKGPLRVELDVAALDAAGAFNTTLKASDFGVYEDGVAQNITELDTPDAGSNILMLFDHNDTWLANDTPLLPSASWRKMQEGILAFINSLQPQDRMAIAGFEDHVTVVLPWRTRSGPSVTAKLSDITARPMAGKNLYGALEWAASQFENKKGRKVVIVFTDGRDARLSPRWFQSDDGMEVLDPLASLEDTGEKAEFVNTLGVLRASGVQVYFIAPFPDYSAPFVGPSGRDYHLNGLSGNSTLSEDYLKHMRSRMEKVVQTTGGRVFFLDKPEDAPNLYANLPGTLALANSYHIAYTPAARPGSTAFHRVEVRIRNGELRSAQSRSGFFDE